MASSFRLPPNISLASVDIAEGVTYETSCRIVEGVVSPCSQGGWSVPGSKFYVHCLTLANWRFDGGPLVGRELTLLRPVPPLRKEDPDGEELFGTFPAYSIQRFSVVLSVVHDRAVVEQVLPIVAVDDTWRAVADRLREPVVVFTERFGRIVKNPQYSWFEGKAKWNRRNIDLCFEADGTGNIDGAVKTAERLWDEQAEWKQKIDAFAVAKLLPLKNDSWLDEDESELSPQEFVKRMKLRSVSVDFEGGFAFWHDDGDMFCGHAIQVWGSLKEGLVGADIPG